MVLVTYGKRVLVFHEERFQLPALSKFCETTDIANIHLCFLKTVNTEVIYDLIMVNKHAMNYFYQQAVYSSII